MSTTQRVWLVVAGAVLCLSAFATWEQRRGVVIQTVGDATQGHVVPPSPADGLLDED